MSLSGAGVRGAGCVSLVASWGLPAPGASGAGVGAGASGAVGVAEGPLSVEVAGSVVSVGPAEVVVSAVPGLGRRPSPASPLSSRSSTGSLRLRTLSAALLPMCGAMP